MNATISIPRSVNGRQSFVPLETETQRLLRVAEERGWVKQAAQPGRADAIEKNGFDLANLADVRSQWIDITPEMAERWLKNNFRNRPVKDDVVRAYARDMLIGNWVTTHQGIGFNDRDELIDGQHRLLAIVMSGRTVRTMVTFGLPSAVAGKEMTTMDAVDRGATRSVADQLKIQHGMKNGSLIAQLAAALSSICCGERTRRLSVGQTLETYRAFRPALDYVIVHRPKQQGLRAAGIHAGFAFALMTEFPEGGSADFWDRETPIAKIHKAVLTEQGLVEGTPAAMLHTFLISDEAKLFTYGMNRGLAELVLQAIWLQLQGLKVEKLEFDLAGTEHFRSLQPMRCECVAQLFKLPEKEQTKVDPCSTHAPVEVTPEKPTLEKLLFIIEERFEVSRLILCGKGTADDIQWPRQMFVSLAMHFGHLPAEIGRVLKRSPEAVWQLQVPRKHLSPQRQKVLDSLIAKAQIKRA